MAVRALIALGSLTLFLAACSGSRSAVPPAASGPSAADLAQGRQTFRFDTFGDEAFWTGTLQMNQVVETAVDPTTALSVGLKVDADALPASLIQAILAGQVDMHSPATTVALLKLNAVVGVQATVDANNHITQFGVTCALCHSSVDNRIAKGIGSRLDGWPNRELNPGAIIALSPAVGAAQKAVYQSWGAGKFDPRFNFDGKSTPVVIPPAYGLAGVNLATYTGDGDISYWNRYVAVTQMHGQGAFADPRIGVNISSPGADLVAPTLPDLKAYQLSLLKPTPPPVADASAVARGFAVFTGQGRCIQCHTGLAYTDANVRLHDPAETGADPAWALRSATKQYRTTPLRGLAEHPPYFHDGSAATLDAVVGHYDTTLQLQLSAQQQHDLVAFLQTL